jgi:hypothetical protein
MKQFNIKNSRLKIKIQDFSHPESSLFTSLAGGLQ